MILREFINVKEDWPIRSRRKKCLETVNLSLSYLKMCLWYSATFYLEALCSTAFVPLLQAQKQFINT
jgi:hypothetical protein